jgi:hypothetical protein
VGIDPAGCCETKTPPVATCINGKTPLGRADVFSGFSLVFHIVFPGGPMATIPRVLATLDLGNAGPGEGACPLPFWYIRAVTAAGFDFVVTNAVGIKINLNTAFVHWEACEEYEVVAQQTFVVSCGVD